MAAFLKKHRIRLVLFSLIAAYIAYFCYFTVLRYRTLYASYFDLGIMNQTVYNSFMAIKTGDWSRMLELTNPFGWEQIKRMAIHNDIILAPLALFYFLHAGPETLLVIQTVAVALGALALYRIGKIVLTGPRVNPWWPVLVVLAYLLYPPLERANIFDFHAVVLATPLLLFMFADWLEKRYWRSLLFLGLSLLTKEEVGLTAACFGLYVLWQERHRIKSVAGAIRSAPIRYGLTVICLSLAWFGISMFVIIPYFRGSVHFALKYYGDFGDSPLRIIAGIIAHPRNLVPYLFRPDTFTYFLFLLGPIDFFPLLAPPALLIALPELAINLLSSSWNMRLLIYHYTAVIHPWVFIAGLYGMKKLFGPNGQRRLLVAAVLLVSSVTFAYLKGPLPFAREREIHPLKYPQAEARDIGLWASILKDERYRISSTGQLAPFLTNRRYFDDFSSDYVDSDYVIVRKNEIFDYPEKNTLIPIYQRLQKDDRFKIIYQRNNFVVYQKIAQP